MKLLSENSTVLVVKFVFTFILLSSMSCRLPARNPTPPECQSASACGSLYTAKDKNCDNNRRTDKVAIVSNKSSSKRIYFLIEFWQTEMYQNWPGQRTFIESKLFLIEPKSTWTIGCLYGGELPEDSEWIRNEWKLVKKCFADDPDCPALKNPSVPSPDPIDCRPFTSCYDDENNYCMDMSICNSDNQIKLLGNDLYRLNDALMKSNMALDNIDLKAITPYFYQQCDRENFIIKNRKFQFNGSSCDFGFQINHPQFDNLYLKMSSTLEGEIRNSNYGSKYVRLMFDNEHKAPLIMLEKKPEADGDISEIVEETVVEISLTNNQLYMHTSSERCIRIDFCYRPDIEG